LVAHWSKGGVPMSAEGDYELASIVRPYAWTGGRTRPRYDLAIEALVETSDLGRAEVALMQPEHRDVASLCMQTRSVAEIAALLGLPLGVARVLVGDMAAMGLVIVHQTVGGNGELPNVAFLERVLSGLRRL
jgi:Protein of unknown function (DUF742)